MSSAHDDSLEEAWALVEASWDDDGAHKRFIAVCDAIGRLDEAAGRYREVRDEDPERAVEAKRRIDQIVARALATLEAQKVEPPAKPQRHLLWLSVMVFLAITFTTMWMIRGL